MTETPHRMATIFSRFFEISGLLLPALGLIVLLDPSCVLYSASRRSQAPEWPCYGGDAGGMRHSQLNQINRKNVSQLQIAWTFDTSDVSDGTEYPTRTAFESSPLVIDGVMHATTPFCRLLALDPETGKQLWAFDPRIDKSMRTNLFVNRGAAYWSDGKSKRLFLGDLQGRLFSIDISTGNPDVGFGQQGMLDLTL